MRFWIGLFVFFFGFTTVFQNQKDFVKMDLLYKRINGRLDHNKIVCSNSHFYIYHALLQEFQQLFDLNQTLVLYDKFFIHFTKKNDEWPPRVSVPRKTRNNYVVVEHLFWPRMGSGNLAQMEVDSKVLVS